MAKALSPYFVALANSPQPCPWCHGITTIEPSPLNPNVAVCRCAARCGWFQAVEAPARARVTRVASFSRWE